MSSVKIVLRKKQNKDGTYPLALRITKDRKSSYVYLGQAVKEDEWDHVKQRVKKSHPNSARLNNFILAKLAEANDSSLELETTKELVSAQAVKQKVKPSAGASFFEQADLYIARLKDAGKYNRYTPDKSRLANFKAYLKSDHAFQDITVGLLERFKDYAVAVLGQSERSAINHLSVIRSVFSQAIKDEVLNAKYYPFGRGKVVIKFPESKKIGLNAEEVERLETLHLDGKADHARNLWLFSFYFAGMRVSDELRLHWNDFQDQRLHYTMGKNNKTGSLKVPEKAQAILDRYHEFKESGNDLIFPELKGVDLDDRFTTERTIAFKVSAIDKVLQLEVAPAANIEKNLTMHIARHTFGNLSKSKIPPHILQGLYRHGDLKTTIGYQQNFINDEADDALDKIINVKAKTS